MSIDGVTGLDRLRAGEPAFVDRSDRGFVRVTGPDALTFLQALVSADLDALGDGDTTESLLLHPQGKLDVAFRLLRDTADDFWLDTDPGLAPQLVASLQRFRIRVDVSIEDRSGEWAMLTAVGSELALGSDGPRRVVSSSANVGVDVLGPRDDLGPVRERLVSGGAVEIGAHAWEAFRIERGIPCQPADIDDSTIPQEAELELDAVSFTKGCFLGQELVCRIDARGHVNRFLRRLREIDGVAPEVGSELVAAGKVVGAVTSVTPSGFTPMALGYVRREVEPGAAVEVRSPGGTARARVAPLHSDT